MASEKHLYNLLRFWLALGIPVVLWFFTSMFIWLNDAQLWQWQWDSDGYRNYWELYKLPIAMLSLIFPAVGLAAATHRSEQMAANLKLQRSQNNLANYYQHRREFCDYLAIFENYEGFDKAKLPPLCKFDSYMSVVPSEEGLIKYKYSLFDNLNSGLGLASHALLFPDALDGDLSVNEDLLVKMDGEKAAILDSICEVQINGQIVSEVELEINGSFDSVCGRSDFFSERPGSILGLLASIEFVFQLLAYGASFHKPYRMGAMMNEEDIKKFPHHELPSHESVSLEVN
jgi:hypothetical protein